MAIIEHFDKARIAMMLHEASKAGPLLVPALKLPKPTP